MRKKINISYITKAFLIALAIFPLLIAITRITVPNNTNNQKITIKYGSNKPDEILFQIGHNYHDKTLITPILSKNADGTYNAELTIKPEFLNKRLSITSIKRNTSIDIYSIKFDNKTSSKTYQNNNLYKILIPVSYLTTVKYNKETFSINNQEVPPITITLGKIEESFNVLYFYKVIKICIAVFLLFFLICLFYIIPKTKIKAIPTKYIYLPVCFILIITLPLLANIKISHNPAVRKSMNQPSITENDIFSFFRKYSKYYSETFGFRNELVKLNCKLNLFLFNKSAVYNQVSIGKNNWLYSTTYINDKKLFTDEELSKIKATLVQQKEMLDSLNIKFYLFIPPTKEKIYNEFTPNDIKSKLSTTKIEQLKLLLADSDIKIIDPTKELLLAKNKHELYFPNDTHWNFNGALVGFNTLLKEIGKDFNTVKTFCIDSMESKEIYSYGDLGRMLNTDNRTYHKNYKPLVNNDIYTIDTVSSNKYYSTDYLQIVSSTHPDTTLPKAIFFRDSYTITYTPYVLNSFSKCTLLWSSKHIIDYSIIKEEKPDIVVREILEYYLTDLLITPIH